MTAGQVSDYTGAAPFWSYDADWFRDAFQSKGTRPAARTLVADRAIKYDKRWH